MAKHQSERSMNHSRATSITERKEGEPSSAMDVSYHSDSSLSSDISDAFPPGPSTVGLDEELPCLEFGPTPSPTSSRAKRTPMRCSYIILAGLFVCVIIGATGVAFFIIGVPTSIPKASARICYDSNTMYADEHRECAPDQLCYSEYYATERNGTVTQYYDRFCLDKAQCKGRGIQGCVEIQQLDIVTRESFYVSKLNTSFDLADSEFTKIYTRFCCCDSDYCNNWDVYRTRDAFGILPLGPFSESCGSLSAPLLLTLLALFFF